MKETLIKAISEKYKKFSFEEAYNFPAYRVCEFRVCIEKEILSHDDLEYLTSIKPFKLNIENINNSFLLTFYISK